MIKKSISGLRSCQAAFRKAAGIIAARGTADRRVDYACVALLRTFQPAPRFLILRGFFIGMFKPERSWHALAWYGATTTRNREARIMALLLCAEIIRTDPDLFIEVSTEYLNSPV